MTAWVDIYYWIIVDISISIIRLRIPSPWHNRIRLDKPAQPGVIGARIVIHQTGIHNHLLEDIAVIRACNRPHVAAHLTEGHVTRLGGQSAGIVGNAHHRAPLTTFGGAKIATKWSVRKKDQAAPERMVADARKGTKVMPATA